MTPTTTALPIEQYEIKQLKAPSYRAQTPLPSIKATLHRGAIELRKEYLLEGDELILSTYGKYALPGVKLTDALLGERKADMARENTKRKK
jgi:hypothetical protein